MRFRMACSPPVRVGFTSNRFPARQPPRVLPSYSLTRHFTSLLMTNKVTML
ncbi:hypothetical protein J27TS7_12530 [Paenibacillus dendritiformis]|nr:hypothetical protein J27TS7_12530 [Paenibacillus dendritiformis]